MQHPDPDDTPLLQIAQRYHASGRTVFPVAAGTKWPSFPNGSGHIDLAWTRGYTTPVTPEHLRTWFSRPVGISVVTGRRSAVFQNDTEYGLEVIDIDDAALVQPFFDACDLAGLAPLLAQLVIELTPRHGVHIGYCCETIDGNKKLASSLDPTTQRPVTLIETRGEGGQIVAAPTPPGIHPQCPTEAYVPLQGSWEQPPIITPDQREALFQVARAFNTHVEPSQQVQGPGDPFRPSASGETGPLDRPGDRLNQEADASWWSTLLTTHGWTLLGVRGAIQYWRRPGKTDMGCSATYGACGPYLYVFSSNASPFDPERAYTPFAAQTLLEYGGDFKAAARGLSEAYTGWYPHGEARAIPDMRAPATGPEDEGDPPVAGALTADERDAAEASATSEPKDAGKSRWSATPPPTDGLFDLKKIPGLVWTKGKQSHPEATAGNYNLIFQFHPAFYHAFWWDEIRGIAMMDHVVGKGVVTEELLNDLTTWLQVHCGIRAYNTSTLRKAVEASCMKQRIDLLRQYVFTLPTWDGTPRLDTWLCDYAGADPTPYAHCLSRLIPLSMMARALDPGGNYRDVFILCGDEGIGKSLLVQKLGEPDWYCNLSMGFDNKEAHMLIRGAWVAELSELNAYSRTEESRMKSFITMTHDSYVPKYSNDRVDIVRRTVFIGTTNERMFLKGDTGNTRYNPISVATIDIPGFVAIRDQLLAEALVRYQANPAYWFVRTDEEQEETQAARSEAKMLTGLEDEIQEYLDITRWEQWRNGLQTKHEPLWAMTTVREIFEGLYQANSLDRLRINDMRIVQSLKNLGYQNKGEIRLPGRPKSRYWSRRHLDGDTPPSTVVPF